MAAQNPQDPQVTLIDLRYLGTGILITSVAMGVLNLIAMEVALYSSILFTSGGALLMGLGYLRRVRLIRIWWFGAGMLACAFAIASTEFTVEFGKMATSAAALAVVGALVVLTSFSPKPE